MSLPSATRIAIEAQLAILQTQLDAANTAYTVALGSGDVESYTFDSNEGKQSTTLRSPTVIFKQIEAIQSRIDRLTRRLTGAGLVNLNLRRG
jgi:hypothetical protein